MAIEVAKILLSKARVFYAVQGTALPADTVAAGAAWPSPWTHIGATSDAVKFAYEWENTGADVQDALSDVRRWKTAETGKIETVLAETDLDKLAVIWDSTVTTQNAGVGIAAKKKMKLGGKMTLTQRTWAFEGVYSDPTTGNLLPLRVLLYVGVATAGGELEFSKTTVTGTPFTIECLADPTRTEGDQLIYFEQWTAAPTS